MKFRNLLSSPIAKMEEHFPFHKYFHEIGEYPRPQHFQFPVSFDKSRHVYFAQIFLFSYFASVSAKADFLEKIVPSH